MLLRLGRWMARRAGGGSVAPSPFDPDALAYITAVEAADTQALEAGVRVAIDDFVRGCKADGIWSAIKASCILAGARTLTGALVPLVGAAPTNFNFVSGDYNRRTGLLGNGTTKYLNTNRNNNADPQDSKHVAVFAPVLATGNLFNSGGAGVAGRTGLARDGFSSVNNDTATFSNPGAPSAGFTGLSRSNASNYIRRTAGSNATVSVNSGAPNNNNIFIFARPASPVDSLSASRIGFYSIGENLNLAQLDSRVSTLMPALEFGINTGLPASDYDAGTVDYINRGYAAGGSLS
jgi:hypothetical protein